MKNRILKKILFGICSFTILTGCANHGGADLETENSSEPIKISEKKESKDPEIPDDCHKEIDGVKFEIDNIEVPDGVDLKGLYECNPTRQIPNQDSLVEKYSTGKEVIKHDSLDTTAEDGNKGVYEYIAFSDGSNLYASIGSISYITDFATKISYAFDVYNLDKYASDSEFDFMSVEESLNLIQNELAECGFELDDFDYKYYALDYETLEKEETHEEKVGDKLDIHSEWSDSDNCYMFYINPKNQGIPVYYGSENFMEDTDPTMMHIVVQVSKDGITELHVSNLFSFSRSNDEIELIAFEQCAQTVANKYGQILSDGQYCVDRAKLYFVPILEQDNSYSAKLAWLFEINEQNDGNKQYMLIDAENAQEITL